MNPETGNSILIVELMDLGAWQYIVKELALTKALLAIFLKIEPGARKRG